MNALSLPLLGKELIEIAARRRTYITRVVYALPVGPARGGVVEVGVRVDERRTAAERRVGRHVRSLSTIATNAALAAASMSRSAASSWAMAAKL